MMRLQRAFGAGCGAPMGPYGSAGRLGRLARPTLVSWASRPLQLFSLGLFSLARRSAAVGSRVERSVAIDGPHRQIAFLDQTIQLASIPAVRTRNILANVEDPAQQRNVHFARRFRFRFDTCSGKAGTPVKSACFHGQLRPRQSVGSWRGQLYNGRQLWLLLAPTYK